MTLLAGGAGHAAAAAPPDELARRILADPRYQRSLPGVAAAGRQAEPSTSTRPSSPSYSLPATSGGAVVRTLFWGFGAAALGVLALVVIRAFARRPGEVTAPSPAVTEAPPPPSPDAGTLAAAGRYGEAVHALLLSAILHHERRLASPLPPSRTSRELVRLLPLHPDARPAFADLVLLAEGWLFGGATVSSDDFTRGAELHRAVVGRSA